MTVEPRHITTPPEPAHERRRCPISDPMATLSAESSLTIQPIARQHAEPKRLGPCGDRYRASRWLAGTGRDAASAAIKALDDQPEALDPLVAWPSTGRRSRWGTSAGGHRGGRRRSWCPESEHPRRYCRRPVGCVLNLRLRLAVAAESVLALVGRFYEEAPHGIERRRRGRRTVRRV